MTQTNSSMKRKPQVSRGQETKLEKIGAQVQTSPQAVQTLLDKPFLFKSQVEI